MMAIDYKDSSIQLEDLLKRTISEKLRKYLPKPPDVWVGIKSEHNLNSITAKVRTEDGSLLVAKNELEDVEIGARRVIFKLEKQLKKKNRSKKRRRGKIRDNDFFNSSPFSLKFAEFPYVWGYVPNFNTTSK